MFTNKRVKGNIGEDIAIEYLEKNGYKIIDRNFSSRFGEIDIIARKDYIVAFIEVKTRSSIKYGNPYEFVDKNKQRKIGKTALYYIKINNLINTQFSFDIMEVFLKEQNKINHIKDAFWI
ncbi:YraN family protein [Dethiothermospora halolimnae]|uniref:YraN family protein n=1 Tax=Dethiothermospora halolimnae TaxID=3114390 RepID=UPI003CCB7915